MPDIGPHMIRVEVYESKADDAKLVHDKVGDHGERGFRDWLLNTIWWAARNEKVVVITPVEIK